MTGDGEDVLSDDPVVGSIPPTPGAVPGTVGTGAAVVGMTPERAREVCAGFVSQILNAYPNYLADSTGHDQYRLSKAESDGGQALGMAAAELWFPDLEKAGKGVVTIGLIAWGLMTMLPRMADARRRKLKAGADAKAKAKAKPAAPDRDPLDAGTDGPIPEGDE